MDYKEESDFTKLDPVCWPEEWRLTPAEVNFANAFCDELEDKTNTDPHVSAYIESHGFKGKRLKPKEALDLEIEANGLINNPRIQRFIRYIMDKRESRADVSREKLLNSFSDIAFSDIRNYMTIKEESIETGGAVDFTSTSISVHSSDTWSKAAAVAVQEVTMDSKGAIKVKMHSKLDALKALMSNLGYDLPRKLRLGNIGDEAFNTTGTNENELNLEVLSPKDLERLSNMIMRMQESAIKEDV